MTACRPRTTIRAARKRASRGFGVVFLAEYAPELNVMGFPVFDRDGQPCLVISLLGVERI